MMNTLADWLQITGKDRSVQIVGIHLIGLNAANAWKLLVTICFIVGLLIVQYILRGIARVALGGWKGKRIAFWIRQGIRLLTWLILLIGIISIWFENGGRLATFFGLLSAGLAFALQRVVTAFAGYFVILRGNTFNVGDRITMGGVRGDVIALGFIQTTIMEMGQAPAEQEDNPSMWVRARQYTGRIVTVTNDKVFDTPIFNYTREFPYIWEEMRIPISYKDNRRQAEQILLQAAGDLTVKIADLADDQIKELQHRYVVTLNDMRPRVYWRLTDNWIEMTVRFICADHGIREIKDAMSRRIIDEFDKAGIGIASGTYDIVGLPPIHVTLGGGASQQPKLGAP
jgi:small-conductance mechanosensitive channel